MKADSLSPSVVAELRSRLVAIVGPEHVSADGKAADHPRDWWPLALKDHPGARPGRSPVLVVAPAKADEVARALRACADLGVTATPYGGGSGVVGSAIPSREGVLLNLSRLRRLRSIDHVNQLVTVEAGMIAGQLEERLRAEGFTLGLYPQSLNLASVGGWVATRAIGTYSGRYGDIGERLAGVEVVLADGTLAQTPVMPRWAIGPDLGKIFVGSEGTLGVVTAVTLRFVKWPARRLLRAYRFASLRTGLEAVQEATQAGLRPALVRLYDADASASLRAVTAHPGDGCLLLLAFDGPARLAELEEHLTLERLLARGAVDLGREPAERWDGQRLRVPPEFAALRAPGVMADFIDVQAPWDRIEETYLGVREALRAHGTTVTAHFSHVYEQGSSCYFVVRIEDIDDDRAVQRYLRAWEAAIAAALASGGTVAHHHGVGLARAPWFAAALGEARPLWALLRNAFDPHGILNPGKLDVGGASTEGGG